MLYVYILYSHGWYWTQLWRTPSPPDTKIPASAGFFVSDREVGKIQTPCAAPRVRLPGTTAREDVDAGDARRARTMDKVRTGTGREGAPWRRAPVNPSFPAKL